MMKRIIRVAAAQALLMSVAVLAASTGLAACGGGSPAAAQGGGTPDASTDAIVACYRAHGDPSFPDSVYDPSDGRWHFAVSPGSAPASTQRACQHLFPSDNSSPPVPQAQFQKLVRLAECLRQHGDPSWPDPSPDGAFGVPYSAGGKTPAYIRAAQACNKYWPSGGITIYTTS
jgi:hypothetical protein